MIRACTHEAREGEGLENRNAEKDEGVRLFLSRECCARVYVYGLTFLSAEDRRASTRMAHRKSSTMRFARTAMRVARARAPISMILPPPRSCVCACPSFSSFNRLPRLIRENREFTSVLLEAIDFVDRISARGNSRERGKVVKVILVNSTCWKGIFNEVQVDFLRTGEYLRIFLRTLLRTRKG